jgi:hypothetical protein
MRPVYACDAACLLCGSHAHVGRYTSSSDCIMKTLRAEGACIAVAACRFAQALMPLAFVAGPLGLYKGFAAQVARIGPHTLISFIAFEQVRARLSLLPPCPPPLTTVFVFAAAAPGRHFPHLSPPCPVAFCVTTAPVFCAYLGGAVRARVGCMRWFLWFWPWRVMLQHALQRQGEAGGQLRVGALHFTMCSRVCLCSCDAIKIDPRIPCMCPAAAVPWPSC